MDEPAELAGFPGRLDRKVDPNDLPESFEWTTRTDWLRRPVREVEAELQAAKSDAKGTPLALRTDDGKDVLVEIAQIRRTGDGLRVVLRERSGTSAMDGERTSP